MKQTELLEHRLAMFGYIATETDASALRYLLAQTENDIRAQCNIDELPADLLDVVIDRTAGAFLKEKKATGQLEDFDLDIVEKSISEGDTSVTYAAGDGSLTPEQRLDKLIADLTGRGKDRVSRYRRLVW